MSAPESQRVTFSMKRSSFVFLEIPKGDLFYGNVVPDAGLAKLGHGKG